LQQQLLLLLTPPCHDVRSRLPGPASWVTAP
jgi:hypothetical protein